LPVYCRPFQNTTDICQNIGLLNNHFQPLIKNQIKNITYLVLLNNSMRNERLQAASKYFVARFSPFLTHMLTLNLLDAKASKYVKKTGWAKGAIQHSTTELTDDTAIAALRYFITTLNSALHGYRSRKARYKDVCRVLAIPVYEGTTNGKRRHFHILLGNVPADKLGDLEKYVADAWAATKWGMPGVNVKSIYDVDGAAFYTGKEVGYYNADAVLWQQASIPNRLIGARA
jgi:hypothetical protein